MQVNVPSHASNYSTVCKGLQDENLMTRPQSLYDLNPIENFWTFYQQDMHSEEDL